MVEVPSVLLQIEEFAELVDFFSVGSNDLTQYLLAVDRNNPRVANVYSHFHPAVLRALTRLVKECHKYNKPVSICGEMAGDPLCCLILLGMELDELSMNHLDIPRIKRIIRKSSLEEAKVLLEKAMSFIENWETNKQKKTCSSGVLWMFL